jgi:hypothetical protein
MDKPKFVYVSLYCFDTGESLQRLDRSPDDEEVLGQSS